MGSPLREQLPDAARRGVNQHDVRRAHREGIIHQILRGEGSVECDAGPVEWNAFGDRNYTCRRQDTVSGVGTDWQVDVGHPIAHPKIAYAIAHSQHMARSFNAQAGRK